MDQGLREATKQKYQQLVGRLTENTLRLWAAAEAMSLGRGGITLVAGATGLSRTTFQAGIKELEQPLGKERSVLGTARFRIRRPGGGRKPLTEQQPELLAEFGTLGGPAHPGRSALAAPLDVQEHPALGGGAPNRRLPGEPAHRVCVVGQSGLQPAERAQEPRRGPASGSRCPVSVHRPAGGGISAAGQPVISVDTKKKELVGDFTRTGQEWQPKGRSEVVRVHDFPDPELGKAAPFGVYDLAANQGWVSVGVTHDTAEFAVESIRRRW